MNATYVRLPNEVSDWLKTLAKKSYLSKSDVIRSILLKALEDSGEVNKQIKLKPRNSKKRLEMTPTI